MRLEKKTGYHNNGELYVSIMRKLANRNGRFFQGPDEGTRPTVCSRNSSKLAAKHGAMSQDAQTDWEHATEHAAQSGLVLFVRGDTLFAKGPAKVTGTPNLSLTYRKDFSILQQFDCVFKTPENVRRPAAQ